MEVSDDDDALEAEEPNPDPGLDPGPDTELEPEPEPAPEIELELSPLPPPPLLSLSSKRLPWVDRGVVRGDNTLESDSDCVSCTAGKKPRVDDTVGCPVTMPEEFKLVVLAMASKTRGEVEETIPAEDCRFIFKGM